MSTWIVVVGWLGFTTCMLLCLPQMIKIIKTKNIEGVSLWNFIISTCNFTIWIIYGVATDQGNIWIANAIALLSSLTIIVFYLIIKCKHKKLNNKNVNTIE